MNNKGDGIHSIICVLDFIAKNIRKINIRKYTEKNVSHICSICFEDITSRNKEILPCRHIFHKKCIQLWEKTCYECRSNTSCPMCRKVYQETKYDDYFDF